MREKLKAAENRTADKMMVDRMLTVVEKDCWQPTPETLAKLREVQADLAPAVAAEHATIAKRAEANFGPAPGPTPTPTPSSASAAKPPPIVVKGRVLEEKPRTSSRSAAVAPWSPQMFVVGLAGLVLIAVGWWRQGRDGPRSS